MPSAASIRHPTVRSAASKMPENRAPVDRIDSRGDRAGTVRAHIRACGERIIVAAQRHAVRLAYPDTDVVGKLGADPHEFDYSRVATRQVRNERRGVRAREACPPLREWDRSAAGHLDG